MYNCLFPKSAKPYHILKTMTRSMVDPPRIPNGCNGDDPFNQTPPLVAYNLYLIDTTLVAAIEREGAAWADAQLRELGEFLGTDDAQRWGFEANENEPVLHTHDRARRFHQPARTG